MPLATIPDDVLIHQVLAFLKPLELLLWCRVTREWHSKLVDARPQSAIWEQVAKQTPWAVPLWTQKQRHYLQRASELLFHRRGHETTSRSAPAMRVVVKDGKIPISSKRRDKPRPSLVNTSKGLEVWTRKLQVPWVKTWHELCKWHNLISASRSRLGPRFRVELGTVVRQLRETYLALLSDSMTDDKDYQATCTGVFLRKDPYIYLPRLGMKLDYPCVPEQLQTVIAALAPQQHHERCQESAPFLELAPTEFYVTNPDWNQLLSSSSASLPLSDSRHHAHRDLLPPLMAAKEILVDDLSETLKSLSGLGLDYQQGVAASPYQVIATLDKLVISQGTMPSSTVAGAYDLSSSSRDDAKTKTPIVGSLVIDLPVIGERKGGDLVLNGARFPFALQQLPVWSPQQEEETPTQSLSAPEDDDDNDNDDHHDSHDAGRIVARNIDWYEHFVVRGDAQLRGVLLQPSVKETPVHALTPLPPCQWFAFASSTLLSSSSFTKGKEGKEGKEDLGKAKVVTLPTVEMRNLEAGYRVSLIYRLHKIPSPPPSWELQHKRNRARGPPTRQCLASKDNWSLLSLSSKRRLVLQAMQRALDVGMTLGWIMSHRYHPTVTTVTTTAQEESGLDQHLDRDRHQYQQLQLKGADAVWYKWLHEHFVVPLSKSKYHGQGSEGREGDCVVVAFEHIRVCRSSPDSDPKYCRIQHHLDQPPGRFVQFRSTMRNRDISGCDRYEENDEDLYDEVPMNIQWMNLDVLRSDDSTFEVHRSTVDSTNPSDDDGFLYNRSAIFLTTANSPFSHAMKRIHGSLGSDNSNNIITGLSKVESRRGRRINDSSSSHSDSSPSP